VAPAWAQPAPAASASQAPPAASCPPTAQMPSPDEAQAGLKNARDRGFLWRITKDGRSSYLYGTVHVAKADWMYPGPQTMRALIGSDTVALELDLLDPALQRRMAEAIAARHDSPLPPALALRLQRQAQAECLAPEQLAGLTPMLQIATLNALAGRRDGLDPAYGIDLVIAGIAHGAKKAIVSLETPELQLDSFADEPGTPTAALVESGLDELESGRARPLLNKLVRLWAESDEAELGRYESWCDCLKTEADRRAMRRMIDDRNPALAAGIDALHLGGKTVFAAVGSLHMFGPQGLPALFARRGYQVERLGPGRKE
ncbi:MAG TPA: TraB/GumN family protein, partial [Burkholderiaceae bacterium]